MPLTDAERASLDQELLRELTLDGWFIRDDGHVYIPSDGQLNFELSPARFKNLRGGRGSGKTVGGARLAMKRIKRGLDGIVLSPSVPHFNNSTREELWKWIPWQFVDQHHKTEKWIQFCPPPDGSSPQGAKIHYGGIEDEDLWRGPNVNWLWFDEAARKRTINAWLVAIAGVRIPPEPCAWATTTPRGKGHWLYKFFEKKDMPPVVKKLLAEVGHTGPLCESFQVTIQDNAHNLDPIFYASMLMAYRGKPRLARQELGGEYIEEGERLVDSSWFEVVPLSAIPADAKRARGWDFAATVKTYSDYTSGTKLAKSDGVIYIEHVHHGKWGPGLVEKQVIAIARSDGLRTKILLEEEAGESGKRANAALARQLHGYTVKSIPVRGQGDKIARALGWFSQAQMGNVKVVKAPWNEAFFEEIDSFPGSHDDIIDSISLAYNHGFTGGSWAGVYDFDFVV